VTVFVIESVFWSFLHESCLYAFQDYLESDLLICFRKTLTSTECSWYGFHLMLLPFTIQNKALTSQTSLYTVIGFVSEHLMMVSWTYVRIRFAVEFPAISSLRHILFGVLHWRRRYFVFHAYTNTRFSVHSRIHWDSIANSYISDHSV
jgi:hypothetical protein